MIAKAHTIFCAARFSPPAITQEVSDLFETALEASGEDYNVYVPVMNSLGALGKEEIRRNVLLRCVAALENQLKQVPEDARARILIGGHYAEINRLDDARRETDLAMTLRANEASILYDAACNYCLLKTKAQALEAHPQSLGSRLQRASAAHPRSRPRPLLHGDPEFDRLYPTIASRAVAALLGALPVFVDPL